MCRCYLLKTFTGKSPNPNQIASPYVKVILIKHSLSSNSCLVKYFHIQAFGGQYFIGTFILVKTKDQETADGICHHFLFMNIQSPEELLLSEAHSVTSYVVLD